MLSTPIAREHDACAIIAFVNKKGRPNHATITRTIEALKKMAHRSGDINDEGDGCGVMTDIPVDIWGRRLERAGVSRHLSESRTFFVGHLLVPRALREEFPTFEERMRGLLAERGFEFLHQEVGGTRDEELGPRARAEAPLFWQLSGLVPDASRREARRRLFALQLEIERLMPELHVASLGIDSVVYKVRAVPELLPRVYPELADAENRSVVTLGHSRYSTNTLPTVERAQPFSLLGHNGEINTIERLRGASRVLNIPPTPGGSDSQDLNRILEGLINLYGFDAMEAMAMVFPAAHSEAKRYPEELRRLYDYYRWFFPPSAQGPAAVVFRHADTVIGSVDSLGLRPLWFGESAYEYFLSSEKGVVNVEDTMGDPRPIAPGEKIALTCDRGRITEILDMGAVQRRLVALMKGRGGETVSKDSLYHGVPCACAGDAGQAPAMEFSAPEALAGEGKLPGRYLAACGWQRFDRELLERAATTGREAVGSMGHQGPLACIAWEALPNISEFFKENVAVVTNPAIDREREADLFSTRTILGSRPDPTRNRLPTAMGLELETPVLLGGHPGLDPADTRRVAAEFGACTVEEVASFFTARGKDSARVAVLDVTFKVGESLEARLAELCRAAVRAVAKGAVVLMLDDGAGFADDRIYIDPGLALASVVGHLEEKRLRRRCGVVVRSAAVRNLHDIMFLLGLGADAINPWLMLRLALESVGEKLAPADAIRNLMDSLQKGVEKVMSTMGIHELCGYGRIFSSVGLSRELAGIFQCAGFCASREGGLSLAALEDIGARRLARAAENDDSLWKEPQRNTKAGRILRGVAIGKSGWLAMAEELAALDAENPVGLRHLLGFVESPADEHLTMADVDISVGSHAMPLVISAMSFGSQGESSFRAYADAAVKANIVCMNGEGGEIPDMLGRYRRNRGQQIASGRFGVHMDFLNSADFLEIKVGQGAKPGEGGHLPGSKVTAMVAEARHCKPGITLISPSNHHDIYSIEDLAQIVSELKTANPYARVSIKIPVTSGVGTIAVGVAKAGADIITVSGFEGGTGAAREHAKKYVGLPVEIGVSQAHRALVESELRGQVEIWADGGVRSGADALKLILLGADRVGLGTVALMGVGCISCQRCHLDRCPKGISTQLRSIDEAKARGVMGFSPMQRETEASNLARLLGAIGDEMRSLLARMGKRSVREVVGRSELLRQVRLAERVELTDLLEPRCFLCESEAGGPKKLLRRPLNYLTRMVSDLTMERFEKGNIEVDYVDEGVRSSDRAMGTYLAGAMVRAFGGRSNPKAALRLGSSVPGNGLGAFNIPSIDILVGGGAQDGTAKGAFGGVIGVFKGKNIQGVRVDGSAGKSFAYGAIDGVFFVQNYADSRACVRMSGASVVFGGRISAPVRDDEGNLATRAHLKGFAFEYMTGGRAVVLGDPGPWMCSGMTGGVIYQCLYPEFGFDEDSIRARLATGASVDILPLGADGLADVSELLGRYIAELERSFQADEADAVRRLLSEAAERFVMIAPKAVHPPSAG